jgi:uncharacterized membrane protein
MTLQTTPCSWETQVIRAAQAAGAAAPDATVAAHLAGCSACRELFDVAGAMTRLAVVTQEEARAHRLPAAGQIWWKAQLMLRWEAEERATAPVDLMQRAEVIGGVLAGIALLVTLWPDMHRLDAASGAQTWWPALARLLEPSTFTSLLVAGAAIFSLVAFLSLHQLFAED